MRIVPIAEVDKLGGGIQPLVHSESYV